MMVGFRKEFIGLGLKDLDLEKISTQMASLMQEIFIIKKRVDKGLTISKTGNIIKANGWMICNTATGLNILKMGLDLKEYGRLMKRMEKAP